MNVNEYIQYLIKKHALICKRPNKVPEVLEERCVEDETTERRTRRAYKTWKIKWPNTGPAIFPYGFKKNRRRKRKE